MRARRPLLILLLLLAGVGLACCLAASAGAGETSPLTLGLLGLALALGAAPPVADRVERALGRIRHLAPATRRRVTAAVWVAAAAYLAGTAWAHARDLFPRLHDEHSYMIGARMLARGRLWMPAHPLADFFESFHLLVRPVYASIYFPGTALMNAPGVWPGLPTWVVPVAAAAGVVALAYRVTAELLDDASGLLAALLVVSTGRFRTLSTMVMSQVPAALLGMLLLWAWLRWRKSRRPAWALVSGALAGWAAVTRPVDALAFAAPVALAMVLDLLGVGDGRDRPGAGGRASPAVWAGTAAALAIGAAPFLALQLAFDLRVTGRPFKTPYVLYLEQNQPGSVFGSVPVTPARETPARETAARETAATRPVAGLAQKRIYYQWLVSDEQAGRGAGWWRWLWGRVSTAAANGLPDAACFALLPAGLAGLGGRRWVAAAAVPVFFGLYLLNPFFLPHYVVPLTPPLALLVAAGVRAVAAAPRSPRWRGVAFSSLTLGVLVSCVRSLPEFNGRVNDEAYQLPTASLAQGPLREAVRAPAVLLFRFHPGLSPHDEPVYNSDVAWPDDAAVIRAHDLGGRNAELFRYYEARQPGRHFYLFDRGDNALYDLGTAREALRPRASGGKPGPPVRTFGAGG